MPTGHIGIIAVSPEGAQIFYSRLTRLAAKRFAGDDGPTISLHGQPLGMYIDRARAEDWMGVASMLSSSAKSLALAGASFVLTPDHVVQPAIHLAEEQSPLPWVRMTDLVAERVTALGYTSVGVIGTREAMFGSAYQTILGLRGVTVLVPDDADAQDIHDILYTELIFGVSSDESSRRIIHAATRLKNRGAEAVIVASSEIPLVLTDANCPLPIVEANEVLALGCLDRAASGRDG